MIAPVKFKAQSNLNNSAYFRMDSQPEPRKHTKPIARNMEGRFNKMNTIKNASNQRVQGTLTK